MKLINDNIKSFLNSFFKNETNVLHFGSSLKSKSFNDIDLVILSDNYSKFTKEIFSYNSLIFEVIIIPSQQIFQILELNKINGVYISVFEEGEIIEDKNGVIQEIKELIHKKKIQPSLILKTQLIENQIRVIFDQIKTSNGLETEILLYNLFENLIDYRLLDFGVFNSLEVKYKYKEILKFDPDFIIHLTKIKNTYLSKKSYSHLLFDLKTVIPIQKIQSKKYHSTKYELSAIYDNNLVIQIKGLNTIENFFVFTKEIIISLNVPFYFFKIEKQSSFALEDGFYIVLVAPNKKLRSVYKSLCQTVNENAHYKIEITFPYQLKISAFLGVFNETEFKINELEFIKISNFVIKNINNNSSELLLWYVNLFLGNQLFNTKDLFAKNLLELGKFYGHNFLEDNENQKKLMYRKLGFQNDNDSFEKNIKALYGQLVNGWDRQYLPESKVNFILEDKINGFHLKKLIPYIFLINEKHLIYIFHIIGELLVDSYED